MSSFHADRGVRTHDGDRAISALGACAVSEEPNATASGAGAPASAKPARGDAGSGTGEPAAVQPGTEQADAVSPGSRSPSRLALALPPWLRRRPVIAGFGAGILVVAAVILVAVWPSAQQLKYTGIPAPCKVLTAATLAKYLPEATSRPQSGSVGTVSQVDTCNWSSVTRGQSRILSVTIVVYESSSWLREAQAQYQVLASSLTGSLGKGPVVRTRPVTSLGDQAMSMVITGRPGKDETLVPQIGLVVRSGNADIALNYSTISIGPASPPTIAEQVAGTAVMARDVLTALAHATAVQATGRASPATSAPASAPSPAGPRYTSPRDACALVKASTLAKYVPHAPAGKPSSHSGTPQLTTCFWYTPRGSLLLNLTIYADSFSAHDAFEFQVQSLRQGGNGAQFSGAQPVTGLGQQATATFQTVLGTSQSVWVDAWSGNAEIQFNFQDQPFGPTLSRAGKLTADIAMIRDVLADLPR